MVYVSEFEAAQFSYNIISRIIRGITIEIQLTMAWPAWLHPSPTHEQYSVKTENVPALL